MTAEPLIGPVAPPRLHLMSFNIRRAMEGPLRARRDRWSVRAPAVAELLHTERPTVLGLQEVVPRSLEVVTEALGPDYRFVGRGRNRDGTGEGTPIVYDASRLELRAWRQRPLSARPEQAGSRSWGALFPRTLVSAEFSDRSDGVAFLIINTHLDHISSLARRRSAQCIAGLTRTRGLPTVVMGDLNAGARSGAVRTLVSRAGLVDSWCAAEERLTPAWGTHSGYRRPRHGGRRIDWLLVSEDIRVRAAAVNARRFREITPSDHLPVQAVLDLKGRTS